MQRNRTANLVAVAVAGSALAAWGAYSGMWWLMVLGIMLAPLCFLPWGTR